MVGSGEGDYGGMGRCHKYNNVESTTAHGTASPESEYCAACAFCFTDFRSSQNNIMSLAEPANTNKNICISEDAIGPFWCPSYLP